MPLVLMCGLPCSSKSTRALELKEYFQKQALVESTFVVCDNRTEFKRNEVYADSKKEKDFRSILKSEVQRLISKDAIVILDALNYIKGYRYELYCMSKSSKTTHCVIHCDSSTEDAWANNKKTDEEFQYSREVFDGLAQRFESPDSRNRWDSPLFTVHFGEPLPFQSIQDALLNRKPPPPNQSTQNQPLASTNFMFELDKITQDIVQVILEAQKNNILEEITIPGTSDKVLCASGATQASLGRLRRQFITYTKCHPVEDHGKIATFFVHYLNRSMD